MAMRQVLERVRPSAAEAAELREVASELLGKLTVLTRPVDPRIRAALYGSASRGTWLRAEKDLDIFLLFPQEYGREALEKVVTDLGARLLEGMEKRYAEHPYVRGYYRGFEVELVPCYDMENPSKLKSAVDRTPFHDRFVREHMKGREDEVRLLKQFLRGIGCYGAEAKVEGVSGYLAELLVIRYGSFKGVLEGATAWRYGEVLQLREDKIDKRLFMPAPLIFVDPVDGRRNVASAMSLQSFATFSFAAKEYLKGPREEFFFPRERALDREVLATKLKERGTDLLLIAFPRPEVVEDVLYPQLRKASLTLRKILEEEGFRVLDAETAVGTSRAGLVLELESLELPPLRVHWGPRANTSHEDRFLEKYASFEGKLTEPFIEGDRWCIYLRRRHTSAEALLAEFLSRRGLEKMGVPRYVALSIEAGYELLVGEGALLEEFLLPLAEYLDPQLPWKR